MEKMTLIDAILKGISEGGGRPIIKFDDFIKSYCENTNCSLVFACEKTRELILSGIFETGWVEEEGQSIPYLRITEKAIQDLTESN